MNVKRSIASLMVGACTLTGAGLAVGTGVVLAQEEPEEEQGVEPGRRPHCHRRGAHLEAAAEAISIEVDALRDALRDGQTIAEVAQANGVEVQTVIDALVADVSARLDEAVAEGRLTQDEADEKKAELDERITALVNGERPPGGPRGGPGGEEEAGESSES
jgi:urease gamma subunit